MLDKELLNEKHIAYLPVISAAIAVSFDVGFFSALEISFFTLFSLSEHILFVLQALPIAVVFLFTATLFLLIYPKRVVPRKGASKWSDLSRSTKFVVVGMLPLVFGPLIIFACYLMYVMWQENPETALIPLVLIPTTIGLIVIKKQLKRLYLALYIPLICLTLSLVFGFAFGKNAAREQSSGSVIRLKNDRPPITGRVIRSGERGILLYEPSSKHFRFELWEAISSIETRGGS